MGAPTCRAVVPLAPSLVLAVTEDDAGQVWPVPLVTDATPVRRARPGDGAAEGLIGLLAQGTMSYGDVEVTVWHQEPATGERGITVDQTNESVVVGEAAVVKWTVLADEGRHPAPSLLAMTSAACRARGLPCSGNPRPGSRRGFSLW